MDEQEKAWHAKHGYQVTDASEWLGLSPEEDLQVKFRVALTLLLKRRRDEAHLSQEALAQLIGSSQPRVAKIVAGDKSVSTDLMLKALVATGATYQDLADAIQSIAA